MYFTRSSVLEDHDGADDGADGDDHDQPSRRLRIRGKKPPS